MNVTSAIGIGLAMLLTASSIGKLSNSEFYYKQFNQNYCSQIPIRTVDELR